jgi:hypothetical protein
MAMQAKDPRGDYSAGATNPETGLSTPGGVLEVAVVDIGGVGALVTVAGTRTKTTPGPLAASTQILAADVTRVAASVQNNDATHAAYLGFATAAVVGSGLAIPAGGAVAIPGKYVTGVINAIQASGATGTLTVIATTV